MRAWQDLTEEQMYEARELAAAYHRDHPRTLPTYSWMRHYSDTVAALPHNTLIAFGRVVLDACKALHMSTKTESRL